MFTYNSVPTTCTAKLITGWSWTNHEDLETKAACTTLMGMCEGIISQGFLLDFAIIHSFLTATQLNNTTKHFLEKVGFKLAFVSEKTRGESRHKETGSLHLYAINPEDLKTGVESLKAELTEKLRLLNRPKVQDPARLAVPELKLFALRKNGIVRENTKVDNRLADVLLVTPTVFRNHLRMTYNFDTSKIKDIENYSTRYLKELHEAWRTEKCIYA